MIKFPQFMHGDLIDPTLCDEFVDAFENAPSNLKGLGKAHTDNVTSTVKISQEMCDTSVDKINSNLNPAYYDQLQQITEVYKAKYRYCDISHPWSIHEGYNIQRYKPGEGFKVFHYERDGATELLRSRHLVFMTYLNDVNDGGTEFYYQNFICPAIKGLTIIWPADWTFTHRGVTSFTKTKYIITGWYNYE